jgi:hypothetical protein
MARFRHIALVAGLLAASVGLSACADGFDVDKLDVFGLSDKPKLPGERKPVFPEGVPGVSQGIPPDLVKGAHPTEGDPLMQQTASAPPAAAETPKPEQQAEQKPKPKPKAKPKPKVVRAPAPPPQAAPQSTASQPATGTQAPWPSAPPPAASGASAPWPSSSSNSAPAPWPDAPAPGTFSR